MAPPLLAGRHDAISFPHFACTKQDGYVANRQSIRDPGCGWNLEGVVYRWLQGRARLLMRKDKIHGFARLMK